MLYPDRACTDAARNITACIPSKVNRKIQIPHDIVGYRRHHKIENMFGRLNVCRRVHTRYDCCGHAFVFATCIATSIILWL